MKKIRYTESLQPGDVMLVEGGKYNPLARIIQYATKSRYSHAAMYIGKDEYGLDFVLEASWGGVQVSSIDKYVHRNWVALRHKDMTPEKADEMLDWLLFKIDKGYDYFGLVGIGVALLGKKKNPWDDKSRYWCSELVADAYKVGGLELLVEDDTWKVSPGDLHRQEVFREI